MLYNVYIYICINMRIIIMIRMFLFYLGYFVLKSLMEFKSLGKVVNKDDWNKFIMVVKVSSLLYVLILKIFSKRVYNWWESEGIIVEYIYSYWFVLCRYFIVLSWTMCWSLSVCGADLYLILVIYFSKYGY